MTKKNNKEYTEEITEEIYVPLIPVEVCIQEYPNDFEDLLNKNELETKCQLNTKL